MIAETYHPQLFQTRSTGSSGEHGPLEPCLCMGMASGRHRDIAREAGSDAGAHQREGGPVPGALTVMMIEDSDGDFHLLASSCEALKLPYVIDRQSTGESGVKALLAAKIAGRLPDLVIIDMDLPGLPGYEILKAIRADAQLRAITVIMLTGSVAAEDMDVCAAADQYLVKPQNL